MPRYRFHARVTDGARRTRDIAPADIGNRQYCLSLTPGEYEAEDDEESGLMKVYRTDGNLPREFVCALPAGTYTIETNAADGVVHLFKEPSEPVRVALAPPVVDVANRSASERASLRRLSESHASFWDRQSRATGNAAGTLAGLNKANADFWSRNR